MGFVRNRQPLQPPVLGPQSLPLLDAIHRVRQKRWCEKVPIREQGYAGLGLPCPQTERVSLSRLNEKRTVRLCEGSRFEEAVLYSRLIGVALCRSPVQPE